MANIVDGNCNIIEVVRTERTSLGYPIVVAKLCSDPRTGYLAADEGAGGFGNEGCPSSYGMPCITWFGPGERHPDAETALKAVSDGPKD